MRGASLEHNRAIASGASVSGIGFNASYTGSDGRPASISLNGSARTVA